MNRHEGISYLNNIMRERGYSDSEIAENEYYLMDILYEADEINEKLLDLIAEDLL